MATVQLNEWFNKLCNNFNSSNQVRTLQTEDDFDRLIDKVEQIKWDITGLCETYRKGEGLLEIRAGYWMYETGKTDDNPDAKGLPFLNCNTTKN